MTDERFKAFVKAIHNAYGKKAPEGEILDFLWTKISFIPDDIIAWIEDRFLSSNDKFPTKLHPSILACWHDWQREHPDKVARSDGRLHFCKNKNCIDGILFVQKDEPMYGVPVEFAVNCGDCKFVLDSRLPYREMFEMHKAGFAPVDFEAKPIRAPIGAFGSST